MKILQNEIVNTGGGCLVLDITIAAGSMEKLGTAAVDKIESIVFSDDCVVAYSIKNPFEIECDLLDYHCWTATSMSELRMAVGEDNYWQLAEVFRNEWPRTVGHVLEDADDE